METLLKYYKKIFFLLLLQMLFVQPLFSNSPLIKKERFKPYMIDHSIEGCPTNSICDKKAALIRKKWLKLIQSNDSKKKKIKNIEHFRKKFGVPFPIWVGPLGIKDKSVISWRSPCSHHTQKGNEKIFIGEKFLKNIKNLYSKNEKKFMAQKAFMLLDSHKIKEFFIPRDDTPLLVESNQLIFQFEYYGHYYGLAIKENGQVRVIENQRPKDHWPVNIECPKKLVTKFRFEKLANTLNLGHFCQAIWNKSTKKYQSMIFGHSCN